MTVIASGSIQTAMRSITYTATLRGSSSILHFVLLDERHLREELAERDHGAAGQSTFDALAVMLKYTCNAAG